MISVFLREQKRYTQEDLVKEFHCSEEKTVRILKRLKEYGVLKAVKANDTQKDLTDLVDEDIEIADVEVGENEYLYVFTFVGVITIVSMETISLSFLMPNTITSNLSITKSCVVSPASNPSPNSICTSWPISLLWRLTRSARYEIASSYRLRLQMSSKKVWYHLVCCRILDYRIFRFVCCLRVPCISIILIILNSTYNR